MAIINTPFPNTIANGQLADGAKLQQNYQYIADQVNANAQPGGGTSFTNLAVLGISTTTAINGVGVTMPLGTRYNDALGEINGPSGTFIPQNTGIYRFWGTASISSTSSTTTINGLTQGIHLYVGGVDTQAFGTVLWPFANSTANTAIVDCSGALSLTAGQVVTFTLLCVFIGSGLTGQPVCFQIQRLS